MILKFVIRITDGLAPFDLATIQTQIFSNLPARLYCRYCLIQQLQQRRYLQIILTQMTFSANHLCSNHKHCKIVMETFQLR